MKLMMELMIEVESKFNWSYREGPKMLTDIFHGLNIIAGELKTLYCMFQHEFLQKKFLIKSKA